MKKYSVEVSVGIFVVIGMILVTYMTIQLGHVKIFESNHYTLVAHYENASGLVDGANIEMAGVVVGYVDKIIFDPEEKEAILTFKIINSLKLTDDVIASIKTQGIIGDKFIKLTPGGSEELLNPGDRVTETESPLDIEELVSKYVFGSAE